MGLAMWVAELLEMVIGSAGANSFMVGLIGILLSREFDIDIRNSKEYDWNK